MLSELSTKGVSDLGKILLIDGTFYRADSVEINLMVEHRLWNIN